MNYRTILTAAVFHFVHFFTVTARDYDVKMPSFTFYGESLSLSKLESEPKEINSREIGLH